MIQSWRIISKNRTTSLSLSLKFITFFWWKFLFHVLCVLLLLWLSSTITSMTWATNHIFCHFLFCKQFLEGRYRFIHVIHSTFRFPFDWTTPFGYLAALSLEGIVCISMVLMAAPPFCLLIGACVFLSAFAKGIANDLINFNADTFAFKRSNRAFKLRFNNILQEFADAKQLSWKMPNTFKNILNFFPTDLGWSTWSTIFVNLS